MWWMAFVNIFGGLCLLLYGLRLAGDGLQSVAGGKLRGLLQSVTRHRLLGVLSGATMASIMQSSGATLVMLVGLTGAGYLTLHQSMAVILGADIGTALTAQLLAFHIYDYALLVVGPGALLWLLGKRRVIKSLGVSLLGFGFVFLALKLLVTGLDSLATDAQREALLLAVSDYALFSFFAALILTALLQSSLAVIGLLLALSTQSVLTLPTVIPMILGANIGTCALALFSSLGAPTEARRVAIAHAVFKVSGVLLIIPLLGPFEQLVSLTADSLPRQIANAHLLFNLALSIMFLPLTSPIAATLTRLVTEPVRPDHPGRPKYLDPMVMDTPALAIGQANRELIRMADITQEMYNATLLTFTRNDEDVIATIEERETHLDSLNQAIKLFLTRLSDSAMTPAQNRQAMGILVMINELESIGDIIDKNLMELAKKKIYKGLHFSEEGRKEIIELHQLIGHHLEMVISALTTRNLELANTVIGAKSHVAQLERKLKQTHIQRLREGQPESVETSAIHVDVLTNLKRINSHITNIAYAIVEPGFE